MHLFGKSCQWSEMVTKVTSGSDLQPNCLAADWKDLLGLEKPVRNWPVVIARHHGHCREKLMQEPILMFSLQTATLQFSGRLI